jgi:hypothetical protein
MEMNDMSAMGDQKLNRKDRKKASQNGDRRVRRAGSEVADWAGVAPEALFSALEAVTARGGALRFGYTSDGGAYAVGVYGDGEPYTDYIRPTEDIDEYLRALCQEWRRD